MATIKIFLEDGETEDEVRDDLVKAFTHPETGIAHQETFHQPAGRAVFEKMEQLHEKAMDDIVKEIIALLNEGVSE